MFNVNLEKFGINTSEKPLFNKILRNFYRRVLYTKGQYEVFYCTFENIYLNEKNENTRNVLLKEYLRGVFELDTDPKNKKLIKKACSAVLGTYNYNNSFFANAFEGGAQSFAYYIELIHGLAYETNPTILLIYKDELTKVLRQMQDNRYFVHNAPTI